MTILPGLTTTQTEEVDRFVADLRESSVRTIALFPTAIGYDERVRLYGELERIEGLRCPHVHLRTDCDETEIAYLAERFGAQRFNVHPRASRHPFASIPERYASRFFIENVEVPASDADLDRVGGLCPDFSHLESARLLGWTDYCETTIGQLARYQVGCCHVSAIRVGYPNAWSGGADHHRYVDLRDLDYLIGYAAFLPGEWVSLELENTLAEQLAAADYLKRLLAHHSRTFPPYVSPAPKPTVRTV